MAHGGPCDGNLFAGGEIDVVGCPVHRVAANGHVAREFELAKIVDTGAIRNGRVAGDAAVPQGKGAIAFDVDAAAKIAALVGNLAGGLLAIGDGQGLAAANLDGVLPVCPNDVIAVETKVDVVVARPGFGKVYSSC